MAFLIYFCTVLFVFVKITRNDDPFLKSGDEEDYIRAHAQVISPVDFALLVDDSFSVENLTTKNSRFAFKRFIYANILTEDQGYLLERPTHFSTTCCRLDNNTIVYEKFQQEVLVSPQVCFQKAGTKDKNYPSCIQHVANNVLTSGKGVRDNVLSVVAIYGDGLFNIDENITQVANALRQKAKVFYFYIKDKRIPDDNFLKDNIPVLEEITGDPRSVIKFDEASWTSKELNKRMLQVICYKKTVLTLCIYLSEKCYRQFVGKLVEDQYRIPCGTYFPNEEDKQMLQEIKCSMSSCEQEKGCELKYPWKCEECTVTCGLGNVTCERKVPDDSKCSRKKMYSCLVPCKKKKISGLEVSLIIIISILVVVFVAIILGILYVTRHRHRKRHKKKTKASKTSKESKSSLGAKKTGGKNSRISLKTTKESSIGPLWSSMASDPSTSATEK